MTTPNMGLVLPAVGVTIGPTWAYDLNTALEVVDNHDHTAGNGRQIVTQAIDIDAALTFNGFDAEAVGRVGLVSQAATDALPATVYVVGGDLFYNNAGGTPVQLTIGGSIAGSTGSISGLVPPASASFDSGTASFRWNANATTRASLDAAAIQLRQAGGVSATSITLTAPASGLTSYTLRLPNAAPATVGRFLFTGTTGDSSWVQPDNVTVEVSGTTLRVKDLGINVSKLAANAVETSKIANLQVTTDKIAIHAVTHSRLGPQAVEASNIYPQAVDEPAIAGGAVTEPKILNLNVTTAKLADLAVTTAKIDDLAVTTAKLAALSVTTAKLADLSVTAAKIAAFTITADEIAANAIIESKINNGAVTAPKIGALQVTNSKIEAGAVNGSTGVTMDKLSPRHGKFIYTGTNTKTGSGYNSIAQITGYAAAAGILRVSLQPKDDGSTCSAVFSPWTTGDFALVKVSITGSDVKTFVFRSLPAPNVSPTGFAVIPLDMPVSVATLISGGTYSIDISVQTDLGLGSISFSNYEMVVYQG